MIKTKAIKKLGIYMDYSNAYLMELIDKNIVSRNIEFETNEKGDHVNSIKQTETVTRNLERHLQSAYYLELCEIIKNYNQVVLFGPADTKDELYNLLSFDHNFDTIKIKNINTDKMTESQIHNFLKEYYN
jgi:ADP-heptose:LPS heptosyltransferase